MTQEEINQMNRVIIFQDKICDVMDSLKNDGFQPRIFQMVNLTTCIIQHLDSPYSEDSDLVYVMIELTQEDKFIGKILKNKPE